MAPSTISLSTSIPDAPLDTERLKQSHAAADFESLLIAQMLKSSRAEGSGWLGSGDDGASDTAFGLGEEERTQSKRSPLHPVGIHRYSERERLGRNSEPGAFTLCHRNVCPRRLFLPPPIRRRQPVPALCQRCQQHQNFRQRLLNLVQVRLNQTALHIAIQAV